MTLILETIARHLDALNLNQHQRAEVFHAWDTAPTTHDEMTEMTGAEYVRSEAYAAWRRVRPLFLGAPIYPTKRDIIQALKYEADRAEYEKNRRKTA